MPISLFLPYWIIPLKERRQEIYKVSLAIPLVALDFIGAYKLKPRNAFHVAIMKEFNLSAIISDDSDFDEIEHIKRIPL